MSGQLFDRVVKVTIWRPDGKVFFSTAVAANAIEITELRVTFDIQRDLKSEPNTCDLTITNLSPETRRAVAQHRPLKVILQAGYDGELRHLFSGDLRWADSKRDGSDWVTRIQVADGARAYRHARVARSYKKGTKVLAAVRDTAQAMGLKLPPDIEASEDLTEQFAAGETIVGPARDELTRLLAPYGYRWSIQDGKLLVLKDQTRTGEHVVVSQETGMVGSPEFAPPDKKKKAPKLNVQMRLYPQIAPGTTIKVQSRTVNGMFRVESVSHTGDTHGDDWDTAIVAKTPPSEGPATKPASQSEGHQEFAALDLLGPTDESE